MKKYIISLFSIAVLNLNLEAQNVIFEDSVFKNYLLSREDSINTNKDLEISIEEAESFNGKIDVSNKSIVSLKGIENFKNIKSLDCSFNNILDLDVSKNIELTTLKCVNNNISKIDLKNNIKLDTLWITNNQVIQTLDLINNIKLKSIECSGLNISELNLKSNLELDILYCGGNHLTSLDVSSNKQLRSLYCDYNQIDTLNIAGSTMLNTLYCNNNLIRNLDLENSSLVTIACWNNNFNNIDVSNLPFLQNLYCYNNQLKSLNVKNINLLNVHAYNNPNLLCINSFDYQDKTNWQKDVIATYVENCSEVTDIEEDSNVGNKIVISTFNLIGQSVDNKFKGLVIVHYNDGTCEKIFQ